PLGCASHNPFGIAILPITSKDKRIPFHVELNPPEGGIKVRSFVKCEDIRSISVERLEKCWGTVFPETLAAVEDRLRILIGL
ncbi:MAG: type II toxin-antitoxin system PemK/MazF family toxin, partial [Oculatellaceae cyanobacterium bins.114]|nr:type II toxin-antitoxin system PemK/MazF family toxin [Oculatellaceae cyanobacterium bins.114]